MNSPVWLIAAIACGGTGIPARAAGPPPVIFSCAWVRAENDGSGGGFVVDAGRKWLVTCRHVVADREKVDVFFPWHRDGTLVTDKSEYLGNRPLLRERGLLVTGKVLKRHDAADLALVELESLPPGVMAIPFAANPVRPGDPLFTVGHRLDLDTLFNTTTGPTRQTGRLTNGYNWRGKKLAVNADAVIAQLPIEEGDSGGPVVNALGELVGMVSALRRQTPTAAVVISAAEVRKFLSLDEAKPKPEPAGIGDTLTRATVWVRPNATDFHTAGVLFEKNLILTSSRGIGTAERVGVAFPLRDGEKWVGEREPYRDPVGLHLKGAWRAGIVLARDPARDLAVIRVESVPESARPVPLAEKLPAPGDAIHAMSHPGGLEFAWVYASGSIRQRGRVALGEGDKAARVNVNVLQLPAQARSPGGPVLNGRGELVGVLSARESAQQTGYAATSDEIGQFLDVALIDRPAKTVSGLLARVEAVRGWLTAITADAFAYVSVGRPPVVLEEWCRLALRIDPRCHNARSILMATLFKADRKKEAWAELDRALEYELYQPNRLFMRAVHRMDHEEWLLARGDLDRILDVYPADVEARRLLVFALLALNKDDEAAAAVGDVLRINPKLLPELAADFEKQVNELGRRFPDTPSVQAEWLTRALTAAHKNVTDVKLKDELAGLLKTAGGGKNDRARLAVLWDYVTRTAKR